MPTRCAGRSPSWASSSSSRCAPDAGVGVAGHVDPVDRVVPGQRGDVRVPARGIETGPGQQHDRRTAWMRPVGVHPGDRGRRLDIEFLARLRPERECPLVGGRELLPCRFAYPRSHVALGCQHGRPPPAGPAAPAGCLLHFYDTNVSLTSLAGKGRYGERMPKRVNHEERRQQIADALLRTAAVRGLHATGMREVAAEAGVSLRLVQYYFGTKEELLLAAMQRLAAQFGARATERFRG